MPLNFKTSIIISDTSCLIALSNINLLEILNKLYEVILITPEVASEYGESLPEWITVKAVNDTGKLKAFNRFIDLGESSAIALALETEDAVLIVDDKEARIFASNLGLRITGTLGILIRAYNKGIITDLSEAISQLRKTGFHLPSNINDLLIT